MSTRKNVPYNLRGLSTRLELPFIKALPPVVRKLQDIKSLKAYMA